MYYRLNTPGSTCVGCVQTDASKYHPISHTDIDHRHGITCDFHTLFSIWNFVRLNINEVEWRYVLLTRSCLPRVRTTSTSTSTHTSFFYLRFVCIVPMLTWNICKIKAGRTFTLHRIWRLAGCKQYTSPLFCFESDAIKVNNLFWTEECKGSGHTTQYRVLPLTHGRLLETF
jgi:hypothetical protein